MTVLEGRPGGINDECAQSQEDQCRGKPPGIASRCLAELAIFPDYIGSCHRPSTAANSPDSVLLATGVGFYSNNYTASYPGRVPGIDFANSGSKVAAQFLNGWFYDAGLGKSFRSNALDHARLLPPTLHDWLSENHRAHFVTDRVNQLDLSAMARAAPPGSHCGASG